MKFTALVTLLIALSFTSLPANACPKGEHPYGGTGTHHNGGWCGP